MRYCAVLALLTWSVFARAASYTTYIGDAYHYLVSAIATDADGNTFIAGSRDVVPESGLYPAVTDVFVVKLDSTGNLTVLGTFSGKGTDHANGIAVDPAGNIYIVGDTTSTNFPLRNPLQSFPYMLAEAIGSETGFLMKLTPDGSLTYSTYLGGTTGPSSMSSVAADGQGNAYVTGWTLATDYPHTPGLPAGSVSNSSVEVIYGAFFAKIDPAGSQIVYAGAFVGEPSCGATCQGGMVYTAGTSITVDPAGNAYIAANTFGGLSGTPGALVQNGVGAFVAKVNPAGTGLAYLTFLGKGDVEPGVGTTATDSIYAIAVDGAGNAYLAGSTADPAFPVTAGAFQTMLVGTVTPPMTGPSDAFVAKLNAAGSAMLWATYLGGSGDDQAQTIGVDPEGNVWISGSNGSTDFPVTESVVPDGVEFLAEINSTGSALSYSAIFPVDAVAQALAVDSGGTVHAAGATGLVWAFPASGPPGRVSIPWILGLSNSAGGDLSGRLAPVELISIYGINLGPAVPAYAAFDSAGFLPTVLGGVQVSIDGIAAPLLYVSATQINAVAPVELTAGSPAALQITVNDVAQPNFRVMVDDADPQVFLNAGSAAAINQDGTVNSPSNPALAGSYVAIWATGTGYSPAKDGQMAIAAHEFCGLDLIYCEVYQWDGTPVNLYYTGAAPGMVSGVVQLNFQVSASQGYYFSADGISSNPFTVYTMP